MMTMLLARKAHRRVIGRSFSGVDKVLQNASKGRLSEKHSSGIPKTLSRVRHVAKLHPASRSSGVGGVWDGDDEDDLNDEDTERVPSDFSQTANGNEDEDHDFLLAAALIETYYDSQYKYYWNEKDYDPEMYFEMEEIAAARPSASQIDVVESEEREELAEEGKAELDEDEIAAVKEEVVAAQEVIPVKKSKRSGDEEVVDQDVLNFRRQTDFVEILTNDKWVHPLDKMSAQERAEYNDVNRVREGIDMLDPYPTTRFQSEVCENPHPDSLREPKPHFPRNRLKPDPAFVEKYTRFLFVSGLPPLEFNGEPADLSNAVHRSLLQKTIAEIVDVDSNRVYPASPSSGYVGFPDVPELVATLFNGPTTRFLKSSSPVAFQPCNIEHEFVRKDATLILHNIPNHHTSVSLLEALFPKDTEIGDIYHNVQASDIHFLDKSRALVRFESMKQALEVMHSPSVRAQLEDLTNCRIRYFRARRELIHEQYGPYPMHEEIRKLGPRIVVDGDMPTRPFYISHAGVLLLINVDPALGNEDISRVFQPFCQMGRDVQGSIEFVTCGEGIPTGQAYVGFDLPGEAEHALSELSTRTKLGDRHCVIKLVQLRRVPNQVPTIPERRPDRKVPELWKDLDDWEQYVDPADVEYLEKSGISKHVLDEALRNMRHHNPTFGPLDAALRSEALEPEKEYRQQYKDLVTTYVSTLKECIPTKDNVGDMYELLHLPNEEIGLGIFDVEQERLDNIKKERA